MTTLHITIPDVLRAQLETRAADEGFGTIEQYAEALLRASAEASDEELGLMLGSRAQDTRPGIEFTPMFAEQFREQVRRRRELGESRP